MNCYTYLGYERRKTGFAIVLLEPIKDGEGQKPVLVNGKYGRELPWIPDSIFGEYFANLVEGSKVSILKDFSNRICGIEIVEY